MPELVRLRSFALELADAADRLAMAHFGGPVPATAKPDGTPVTEADEAIERTLRRRIADAYPDHAILGEEGGGGIDTGRPTWVLDPIDGTKSFMRGVPVFATLIALVEAGRAVVGVASAPALGERWDAALGLGACRNGAPAVVSAISALPDALVLYSDAERFRPVPGLWDTLGALHDTAWRVRAYGDFYNHLLVAAGSAEVAFERELEPWDVAALSCIVTEAGGRITDFYGDPVLRPPARPGPNGVLTTNGELHEEMVERLTAALGA